MSEPVRITVKLQDPGDGSGDAMVELPPDVMRAMNLALDDFLSIKWTDGAIVLKPLRELTMPTELEYIPTAKSRGNDIYCPVVWGFYDGPKVSYVDPAWWKQTFDDALGANRFAEFSKDRKLLSFATTG